MPIECRNGCGLMIDDTGATSTSKDGRTFKVYAEVVGNDFKRGPTGQIVNHAFDCPKRKKFNQKALDEKHAQVEAGTYAPTYSATGTSQSAPTGSGSDTRLKFSPEGKSQREEIKEMAEEKNQIARDANKIAKDDIEAKYEIAKALHELARAIRYHADTAGGLNPDDEDNDDSAALAARHQDKYSVQGDDDLAGSV